MHCEVELGKAAFGFARWGKTSILTSITGQATEKYVSLKNELKSDFVLNSSQLIHHSLGAKNVNFLGDPGPKIVGASHWH